MRYQLTLLLVFSLVIWSCEKDDICSEDTETTPRIIIEFYDNDNPDDLKVVENIHVQGIGNEVVVNGYNGSTEESTIILPLKTDAFETSFSIYKDFSVNDNGTPTDSSDDFIEGNEDIITISYLTEDVYVSRACGYKIIFDEVVITVETDTDNWIDNVQPVSEDIQTVENEREAHYKIFH